MVLITIQALHSMRAFGALQEHRGVKGLLAALLGASCRIPVVRSEPRTPMSAASVPGSLNVEACRITNLI